MIARTIQPVRSARIASAIVYKREIISLGICQMKSHPLQKEYGSNSKAIFLHSEIDAIKNAINSGYKDFEQSTLYIVRQKIVEKNWCCGLAAPCKGCQRAIAAFNIKNIVYTTDEGYEIA